MNDKLGPLNASEVIYDGARVTHASRFHAGSVWMPQWTNVRILFTEQAAVP